MLRASSAGQWWGTVAVLFASWWLVGCCSLGLGRLEPRPQSEYKAHEAQLKRRVWSEFTVVTVPPFVVIGDGRPEDVREDAERIVGWAAQKLKLEYFPRDPAEIIDIWLFHGGESYLRNNSAMFGRAPLSPYGYYSSCDRALIVNSGLGLGTLVHEMVHAFIEANFPGCPTWFNEGLASLYEQPDERDGHIRGKTNWRLGALKAAIAKGRSPNLHAVMSSSRDEFYDAQRSGAYYAAARYLLYYLQEHGRLRDYYRGFLASREEDPTGESTLLRLLGEKDLEELQRKWERQVMKLTFP